MSLNLLHIVVLRAVLVLLDSYSCSEVNRFCRNARNDNCFGLCAQSFALYVFSFVSVILTLIMRTVLTNVPKFVALCLHFD
jgi:hypothetical protein